MRRIAGVLALVCCVLPAGAAERARIDLNGVWEFRLDPNAAGEREAWHSGAQPFPDKIQVPGCWQAQGFGERSGILRNHYTGKAWYRRKLAIPADWTDKHVALNVGGVVRRATVFVNGRRAGHHDGFSTPFSLDVSDAIRAGAENTISFLVENPGDAPTEAPHEKSTSPTGLFTYIGNWGGIYGSVELEAASPVWIDEVAIAPDIHRQEARFKLTIGSRGPRASDHAQIEVEVAGHQASSEVRAAETEIVLALPGARLWSPDDPHLYTAAIRLVRNGRELDRIERRFGMCEIAARGDVLLLNGKPLYLRGYGDDNIEVLTGVPPASKRIYAERLRLARSFGFNAVRFHSMTPLREFFEAADEVGMLVMAELPASYTMHFLPHKEFLRNEMERILRVHRNSPSFLSLALGNEFNLGWLKTVEEKKEFQDAVTEFYRLAKSIDPRRLILSNDGLMLRPTDMASLFRDPPGDIPAVRHEFGNYYCSLPDLSLIDRFSGVIVPAWLERKKQWVEDNGLSADYPRFVQNSQRLQQLGRKYQIERARGLPEFTGYHYWLIVDFPGGTGEGDSWEEGWFDYFWRPKGIAPEDGRELNSPVLLMIGAGVDERTLWADSRKRIEVRVSNYGDGDIEKGTLSWKLGGAGGSTLKDIDAPLGKVTRIGEIVIGPAEAREGARKAQLVLELNTGTATYTNRWEFWLFPRDLAASAPIPVVTDVRWAGFERLYPFVQERTHTPDPPALLITSHFSPETAAFLERGGRVWLMADRTQFERSGDATFFPASGGAQGTVVLDHPALRGFPHQGFFDLQFYNLVEGAWNLPLDRWPKTLAPIAGSIRTTSSFLSKQKDLSRTGYIAEAKAGEGRLLVTTLRLREHLDEAYPEALFLFDRLLRYASGPDFNPQVEIGGEHLKKLVVR